MSYIFTWNVHVIFEMYSIQTKIGTYLKNKSVHDLNEDKKTKKMAANRQISIWNIYQLYQLYIPIWTFTFLPDLKNYFDSKNTTVPHIPNWEEKVGV